MRSTAIRHITRYLLTAALAATAWAAWSTLDETAPPAHDAPRGDQPCPDGPPAPDHHLVPSSGAHSSSRDTCTQLGILGAHGPPPLGAAPPVPDGDDQAPPAPVLSGVSPPI